MNEIRLASNNDVPEMLKIYAPYCDNDSAVSFEIVPPSIEEMQERLAKTLQQYPWLVYVCDDSILGYAYASMHRQRAAYRWSVDTSIYISEAAHRHGIAKALYSSLLAILRLQGYINAYAGIALPNPASIGLHKAFGFTEVGIYRQVGYKGSAWHDVAWLELELQPRSTPPEEPQPLSRVTKSTEFSQALALKLDG
jgi:L-amino acid N-acyltransferase YncA